MSHRLASLLATIRCIVAPSLSREQAIMRAREEMERRGGRSGDSVRVRAGLFCYTVFFGSEHIGEAFVKVHKRDGSIRHVGIPLR